ncbi:putative Patched sphingolipid transporter [Taphrina deformans PYCC 5710]|uniref:Patched sphingolipid transporter n=1 Tax=Taphrina deformans (strain PYCC 5710 / ATCC 11124 / CBS 356.35 / IMI 108563 / JCM 9778 / NBRC 8474) TaxID=1097556 RepID=R4XFW5_TAPDE|nr:putative Patched sphingolipid transporter [Taphrina deformans PYCC 5710]|eukprot:CCG82264.1 putative Patched sphingolipid transporter [Taphrina deformans PYCC 5710]
MSSYKHEQGRCMMRGQCGKESFFGAELPCPYNGKAIAPDQILRETVIDVCGDKYAEGPLCCDVDQLEALRSNLKKAENLIASCPACKANFFEFFCTFTCSPNQSQFLDIEDTAISRTGKEIITQLAHYVDTDASTGFYNSCKNVKFSATNGYVMDLIGGGAQTAPAFLKFMGQKSPLGSPIQIDYPESTPASMVPAVLQAHECDDEDASFRCACVDCPTACPTLSGPDHPVGRCHVGHLPCFSFVILIVYCLSLLSMIAFYLYKVRHSTQLRREPSRVHLDSREYTSLADDEEQDDGDDDGLLEPQDELAKTSPVNDALQKIFYKLGFVCAQYPYATIGVSFFFVSLLSVGWSRFAVETNPIRLWVSPESPAAQEKTFFDTTFGPFYRTQQLFLVNGTSQNASVLTYDNLKWWFNVEQDIYNLQASGVMLEDICYKPTGDACVVQSVTGYWQGNQVELEQETWEDVLLSCAEQPVTCLPPFQQPLKPNTILGGYEGGVLQSKALVSSIVVANSLEPRIIARAMAWEQTLKDYLLTTQKAAELRGLRLSFNTEISLEEELNKSTNTDAKIVVLSYIIMFFYASFALGGNLLQGRRTLVETKFSLGLFGILIVLLSISAAVGLFSMCKIKVTLIIAEVIPFLVLAVGVDNIFLLSHEFGRVNLRHNEKSIAERTAITLGHLGPSILLSAVSETSAFALGAVVAMPAVRNFAIYAAGSVFFNAVLQLTMFPAAMAIDQWRTEANRLDCFPFVRVSVAPSHDAIDEGYITRTIRRRFAPYILRPYVKGAVLLIFGSLTAASLALFPKIQLGLDQKVALPRDSYLIPYFQDLENYFNTGPPVYFVVKGANATDRAIQQAMCGRFTTCETYSMANILEQERKRPEVSYLLEPTASWIDDFFYWLNPQLDLCCRIKKAEPETFCSPSAPERQCQACFESRDEPWNISMSGMPEGTEFLEYARAWLTAPSSEDCPIAGKAPYSDAVILDHESTSLTASNSRSFHVPLRTQNDFINSYAAARRISAEISQETGLEVFPYAVHYIFFEQYATIVRLAFSLIGSALAIVLFISTILLGSFVAGALITLTVAMILADIVGVMALWDISLNALSLVNLVICVGIGVEFCSHFARSYMLPTTEFYSRVLSIGRERDQRVWNALTAVGASVFSGITLCKFVGVIVLAFTRSKIFEIYYFRMWLTLVFVAASHGLIFLPVLFSVIGPKGYAIKEEYDWDSTHWDDETNTQEHTGGVLARQNDDDSSEAED